MKNTNNETRLNYFVDICLIALFAINLFYTVNFDRKIHSITGYLLIIFIVIHVLLHSRWFVVMTKSIFKKEVK